MKFPEGWGREGRRKNPFHGGGMDIFWHYTIHHLQISQNILSYFVYMKAPVLNTLARLDWFGHDFFLFWIKHSPWTQAQAHNERSYRFSFSFYANGGIESVRKNISVDLFVWSDRHLKNQNGINSNYCNTTPPYPAWWELCFLVVKFSHYVIIMLYTVCHILLIIHILVKVKKDNSLHRELGPTMLELLFWTKHLT